MILLLCNTAFAAKPPATAVAFAPDRKSVLVASQAGIDILAWPTRKKSRSIETDLHNVNDLAFSPNGRWLLAAGGTPGEAGIVELFSWPDAKSVSVWKSHDDLVYSVAWQADSNGWVTASLDHAIGLFDRSKPKQVKMIYGHSRGVKAVGLLGDGRTLVSGSIDNNLRVWTLKADGQRPVGTLLRAFNNHTRPIHDLAVRPSKDKDALPMVVTVSADRSVRLWQPTIGRMVRFVRLKSAMPLAVRWTPDGSRIVIACSDGHLRVVDPDTVEILQDTVVVDGWAYSLDVHPKGTEAIVGGANAIAKRVSLKASK